VIYNVKKVENFQHFGIVVVQRLQDCLKEGNGEYCHVLAKIKYKKRCDFNDKSCLLVKSLYLLSQKRSRKIELCNVTFSGCPFYILELICSRDC
jgi:hypothetical protein